MGFGFRVSGLGLVARCSCVVARRSLFVRSLLVARCSCVVARRSLLGILPCQLFPRPFPRPVFRRSSLVARVSSLVARASANCPATGTLGTKPKKRKQTLAFFEVFSCTPGPDSPIDSRIAPPAITSDIPDGASCRRGLSSCILAPPELGNEITKVEYSFFI